MKKIFSAIGAGISAIWNWIGRVIFLLVKFFFWVWGAALVSALVAAIVFLLISLGVKAFDSTEFGKIAVLEMNLEMMEEMPELDFVTEGIDFEIIEE